MSDVFNTEYKGLPKPNYEYITKLERAESVFNEIMKYDIIEVDTETTGLEVYNSKIVLVQIGIPNKAFVFDVRYDTRHSDIHPKVFKKILSGGSQTRILQNAVFDMKMFKVHGGFYIDNVYDTMLVEQLFSLGLLGKKADLRSLVLKYLGFMMPKEPATTFQNYHQTYKDFQLEYAANDVSVLRIIRDLQLPIIQKHGFEDVCRLEFEFTKPMCEMELNGIIFNKDMQRDLLKDMSDEKDKYSKTINSILSNTEDQTTLFDVPVINIDSNLQLKKALEKMGLSLPDTSVGTLEKHKGISVIDSLLEYRKAQKFLSTYGESLIDQIHNITGRLHTQFRQMVATGRMSSSHPNLQNIPKKQKYRSCFVAKDGYSLITSDMSSAELRIMGNLSKDPGFIYCFENGIDLHTKAASDIFKIPMSEITNDMRNSSKSISFGLPYGLSKFGLAIRLGITEDAADKMINDYFDSYKGIKTLLDNSARDGVKKGYTRSISGRKRFYDVPKYDHPDRNTIIRGIERASKNMVIQSSNADTIKQAMIYCVDRLEKSGYDAKLLLTVHDEIVVETKHEDRHEVGEIVGQSLIDGFGRYFSLIPMETDVLIGPCWLKSSCENKVDNVKCKNTEMVFDKNNNLICKKCGGKQ